LAQVYLLLINYNQMSLIVRIRLTINSPIRPEPVQMRIGPTHHDLQDGVQLR
jgi:hypothetical protein